MSDYSNEIIYNNTYTDNFDDINNDNEIDYNNTTFNTILTRSAKISKANYNN